MGNMMRWWTITLILIIGLILVFDKVYSCNEAVCASVVSKCMLTQSCKCDLKNCSCCKECSNCLSYLYTECCSCVDMCPKPNDTSSPLSKKSHVEDFEDDFPAVFQALTAEPDNSELWTTMTFPVDHDLTVFSPKLEKDIKYHLQSVEQDVDSNKPSFVTLNCTVAYYRQCMSWNKCRKNCISMGATSYRWFHDGCCQCVGRACIKYGINESRCKSCSHLADDLSLIESEDLEYGEEDFEES